MNLSPEYIEAMMSQILGGVLPDHDEDDDDGASEPPVAGSLEEAAIRVSTVLLQDVVDAFDDIRAALRRAELSSLYALHLAQQIDDGKHDARVRTARAIRAKIRDMASETDDQLRELTGIVKDAVQEPAEDKYDA